VVRGLHGEVAVGNGLVEVGDGRGCGSEGDDEVCDDVVLGRGIGGLGEMGREGKGDGGGKVGADVAFKVAQAAVRRKKSDRREITATSSPAPCPAEHVVSPEPS
jgi:hypothetical protein